GSSVVGNGSGERTARQHTTSALPITTTTSRANSAARTPSTVELVTIVDMSSRSFAGASTSPRSSAAAYWSRWAKNPIFGSSENTFCQLAVSVTAASHASGTAVTQAHLSLPLLTRITVATVSAIAASSWLAIPNSGNNWLMPPSGSVTPAHRK